MSEPLKQRVDFENALPPEQEHELKPGRLFTPQAAVNFYPQHAESEGESDYEKNKKYESVIGARVKPCGSLWRKLLVAGMLLFAVSIVAQSVQSWYQALQQKNWFFLMSASAGGLIVVAGIGFLAAEWRRLYRLRLRLEEREQATGLLLSHGMVAGREFCEKLARQAGLDPGHPALQLWKASLNDTQNDGEVVRLYATLVQPVLDAQARAEIIHHAAQSALMVAVSPWVLVDMFFIVWRNIRLINVIAALYGIELGYFSRMRLLRLVLLNTAFAGASEVVNESAMDWLAQDLTARISVRVAQGIDAGLLTARLGIKTMELCRPLPWMAGDKPSLGDFRRQLMEQLKNRLKK